MLKIKDRVRYLDNERHEKYGELEVWRIKGDYAICKRNKFNAMSILTIKISDLELIANAGNINSL